VSPRWRCLFGHQWRAYRANSTLYAVLVDERCGRCGRERTVIGGPRL
jgi:hypothetical protein